MSRYLALPGFGDTELARLRGADVAVIGAGGLGAPVIGYLAGAGLGRLRIIDDDRVEAVNLSRQTLFTLADVGRPKAVVAADRVRGVAPDTVVQPILTRLTGQSAGDQLGGADVVLDCSDNLPTRYVATRFTQDQGVPLVWGAVGQYGGQCSVALPGGPCFGCLYGPEDQVADWPNAESGGVFAPVCGVVGSLMAGETLKLITGIGQPMAGRLAVIDLESATLATIEIRPDPGCAMCHADGRRGGRFQ